MVLFYLDGYTVRIFWNHQKSLQRIISFFFRIRIPTSESKTMPEIIKRYQSIVFLLLPRRTFKSPAQCHSTTNQHHHHPYPLSSSYVVVVVYRGSNFDHFWQSCIQESDYFLQPWELRPQSSGGILMYSITVNLSIPTSILNMYCTYTKVLGKEWPGLKKNMIQISMI